MERAGYIERAPSDKRRRALESRLTQRGRGKLAACDRAIDEVENVMLGAVPEEERGAFTELLVGAVRALHTGFAERDGGLTGSGGWVSRQVPGEFGDRVGKILVRPSLPDLRI